VTNTQHDDGGDDAAVFAVIDVLEADLEKAFRLALDRPAKPEKEAA